ncbi:MAG TPA: FtsX-like permease family protein [Spirochaetia bacterium]
MRTIVMAWRNLLRHKRRTLTTLSALIVGLCGLVVFQGYIGSIMTHLRESTIRYGLGHLQIVRSAQYFEDGEFNPYAYAMKDDEKLLTDLSRQHGVRAAFPSTGFTSIAGKGEKSVTLLVKAYPAERMFFAPPEGNVEPPADRFELGTLLSGAAPSEGERDRLVLGETAARILAVTTGSVVTLMAVLPDGGLNGRDFTVSAVYRSPGRDKTFAYTDYDTAVDFTGIQGAAVLHVLATDVGAVDAIAARVPSNLTVRTWHDLATYYVQANTMFSGFLGVIRAIILLVTLFIMANTMNRIVRERMKEWGTLRAMGMKKRRLLLLVVLEGSFQGVVGAALGVLLGLGVSALLNLHGGLAVPFAPNGRRMVVKLLLSAQPAWNLLPAGIFAGAASLLPGLRAVRLSPSECLRQI